ncbi:MAG TPA: acetyl-CoA C-acyltransferase [Planctomycetota bacterium]|nr:acetyl-CoA C-acyltransferase [Planctomycetota bacterium]
MAAELVITGGARTPMAEYSGTPGYGKFKDLSAIALGAIAAKEALARARAKPEQIDQVFVGNALQTSADAIYGARHVALRAGIPIEVPALTVNRLCGSGLQAIVSAAHAILAGEAETCLAGGMENLSQAPFVVRGLRDGIRFGVQPTLEDLLFSSLMDPFCGLYMAQTAEKLAKRYSIPREAQDEFALRSHKLGAEAVATGRFRDEIVPVEVKRGRETLLVESDDHIKPDTSAEKLAKLPAAFGKEGTVTAGNASGIVDGAAAVIVTTSARAAKEGWPVLAKIRTWGLAGVDPSEMGIGPVPAMQKALDRAALRHADIGRYEINEAFSAQYLACEKAAELDRAKVNVNGGAIAIGHPLGATGTRLALTLAQELRRSGQRYGLASACIGGGQGIAVLLERA